MPKVVMTLRAKVDAEPGEDKEEVARRFILEARARGVVWLLGKLAIVDVEVEDPFGFEGEDDGWKYRGLTGEE